MEITITEEQLQAACTQWFWNEFPEHRRMLIHVDNNSANRITGSRKKALGVVKGISDLIFIVEWEVIFIELKTLLGTQSEEQKDFMHKVMRRGHRYEIVRSLKTFKEIVCAIIGK